MDKTSKAGVRWRVVCGVLIFLVLPFVLEFLYDQSNLWNPFVDVNRESGPVRISQCFFLCYWAVLWLCHKGAVATWCMPKSFKQICQEFEKAQLVYETGRYTHLYSIEDRFKDDLVKRTPVYLKACKKASAEEIALSALSDIALDLNLMDLHNKVMDRLDEIEVSRSRLDRLVALR